MTLKQRIIAISIASALMLSGFAFGRIIESPKNTSAQENNAVTNPLPFASSQPQPAETASSANAETEAFYLKDFKTGYDEGYNSAATGQTVSVASTDRAGYNEGFKQGYADAYQARQLNKQPAAAPVAYRSGSQQTAYRSSAPVRKSGNSKLKTVLTIAAPAAVGAGIGAAAGGKKGAAIGALIGGGGGAAYHLYKNRNK